MPEAGVAERTICGGRLLPGGRKPALNSNSDSAFLNRFRGGSVAEANDTPFSFLNWRWQSKLTKRLTMTSPTTNCGPMPPPVPVVITHFGEQSWMICFQTIAFGSWGPSCDKCESDLKSVTRCSPIFVVQ